MRPMSVSDIKGTRYSPRNTVPREGTELRRCYDQLIAGGIVNLKTNYKIQLEDFYGIELELIMTEKRVRGRPKMMYRQCG